MATAIEFSEIHRISSEKYHEFIECGALYKAHVELIGGRTSLIRPSTTGIRVQVSRGARRSG